MANNQAQTEINNLNNQLIASEKAFADLQDKFDPLSG